MDMQDKDLDKLFQLSLNELEIEPSAHVWGEIAGKLNAADRKRSIVPYLSIAAGLLLLVTAGLLFIPKMVKVKGAENVKIAKNATPVKDVRSAKATPTPVVALQQNKSVAKAVIAPVGSLAVLKTKGQDKTAAYSIDKHDAAVERQADEPELALASYKDNLTEQAAAANDVISLPVNNLLVNGKNQQKVIAQLTEPKQRQVKRHRIRSLGDVFNVVIAAVDKREDKLIEFSNTDEDDATITGLNLGIIKVKKEK